MVELIWDAGLRATCVTDAGSLLTTGDEASWSTEDLLAGAVAISMMRSFLELAGAEPVLGYVAGACISPMSSPLQVPRVDVRVCVTAATGTSPDTVRALCEQARRQAPLIRLLAAPVHVTCDVEVLADVGR